MDRCEQAPNPFAAHRSSLAPYLENTWPKMQSLWQTRLTTLSSLSTPCESITSLLSAGLRVGPLGLDFSSVGTTADAKSLAATNATMAYYNAGCSECTIVIYIDWELRLASSATAASLAGMNSASAWRRVARAGGRALSTRRIPEGAELGGLGPRFCIAPRERGQRSSACTRWARNRQSPLQHRAAPSARAARAQPRGAAADSYLGDRVAIDGYKIVHTGSLLTRAATRRGTGTMMAAGRA